MKPIAIYGAGSLGREVLMLIRQINEIHEEWDVLGFFDDNENLDNMIDGLPIIGDIHKLNAYKEHLDVIIAVGIPASKKRIIKKITNKSVGFATLIHPAVQLKPYQHCQIGEGSIISAGNIFTVGITIGKHVLINMACTIGHDVTIGDFTSIMPNCTISGEVNIGQDCFIGAGATLLNRVEIKPSSRIGARETVKLGTPIIMQE